MQFDVSEQEHVTEPSMYQILSQIRGLKFLFNRQTGFISKLIWAVYIFLSFILCIIYLGEILGRWNAEPLIVSLTDKPEPIWEIPFPAITICPESKSKQTVFNLTDVYLNLLKKVDSIANNAEAMKYARAVSQVCDIHLMTQFLSGQNYTNTNIYDDLRKIAPSFDETAYYCQFQDEISQCNQFFSEVWTDEGLCFTFNLLNLSDITSELVFQPNYPLAKQMAKHIGPTHRAWSLQNGYERKSEMDPKMFPYEILGAGNRGAFSIVLRMYENDFDYICRGSIVGFKVAIHLTGDLPSILSSNHFIRIPTNQETLVTFQPDVMRTSDSLQKYSPNQRGCYFPNEGTLKYFKEYTQRNCDIECLTDHTLKKCGCVQFSMPRDDSTPICGFEKIDCVVNSMKSILSEKLRNVTNGEEDICNCLPACTQISYSHEISQANFNFPKLMQLTNASKNETNPNVVFTRLTVQAKENYFTAVRRHELYTRTDLLGISGGILSLFLSASLFSITELIFYIVNYFMNRRKSTGSIERRVLKNDDLDVDNN